MKTDTIVRLGFWIEPYKGPVEYHPGKEVSGHIMRFPVDADQKDRMASPSEVMLWEILEILER